MSWTALLVRGDWTAAQGRGAALADAKMAVTQNGDGGVQEALHVLLFLVANWLRVKMAS